MKRRERGFSLIELVVVLSILSILARISIPATSGFVLKANAAKVVGDFNTVRAAAYAYYTDHNDWPSESNGGQTPVGLGPYLPKDFSFTRPRYTLDWENWAADTTLGYTGVLVGVSVRTSDAELGNMTIKLLGGADAHLTLPGCWTLVVQSTLDPG